MCGRVFQVRTAAAMGTLFNAVATNAGSGARYNGAPRQQLLIIRWNAEAQVRKLDPVEWGLVPSWTKDIKTCRRPINARAETIDTAAMFKGAFRSRRCLLPIDGFFEWRAMANGKQPYAIARADRQPFCIAGLWENWQDPATGEWLRTFCVATTVANDLVGRIHDRMPVILGVENHAAWLGEVPATPEALKAMLVPYPAELMTMWPVDPRMNSWKFEDPCILDIIDEPRE